MWRTEFCSLCSPAQAWSSGLVWEQEVSLLCVFDLFFVTGGERWALWYCVTIIITAQASVLSGGDSVQRWVCGHWPLLPPPFCSLMEQQLLSVASGNDHYHNVTAPAVISVERVCGDELGATHCHCTMGKNGGPDRHRLKLISRILRVFWVWIRPKDSWSMFTS